MASPEKPTLRAVLDTNVLVSGLCRKEDSPTSQIVRCMGIDWVLALTPAIFLEYEDVLSRRDILALTGLSRREAAQVLDYVADCAVRCIVHYTWRPNLQDESDNVFVDCAVAASAQYLVTGNKKHFRHAELGPFEFEVVSPSEFARLLPRKN